MAATFIERPHLGGRHCERSEAIHLDQLDCFVAALLAMTVEQ
jgi:hypothetical protein